MERCSRCATPTWIGPSLNISQAVEKGEALDTELRRKVERQHAHTQILDAITGMATFKVATDEMSYQQRQVFLFVQLRLLLCIYYIFGQSCHPIVLCFLTAFVSGADT